MKAIRMKSRSSWLGRNLFVCLLVAGCSVNFDGFVYDDEALKDELDDGDGSGGRVNGDGDGDGSGGGENGDGDGDTGFCATFCKDSAQFCEFGSELGYESAAECRSACASFDTTALECRLVELAKAEDDPDTHCPATLVDGAGICPDAAPDACAEFCAELGLTCAFGSELGYASLAECTELCADFDKNALDCRVIHLGFAQQGDPETHCLHTLLDGGGVCPDATP